MSARRRNPISLRPGDERQVAPAKRTAAAFLGSVIAASACSPPDGVLHLPAEERALTVVVAVGADGAIRRASAFTPGDRVLGAGADRSDQIVRFVLALDALRDPSGGPLAPERLSEVELEIDGDTEGLDPARGTCGRCLDPTTAAPMLVHPGDRCAIPPFAAATGWRAGDDALEPDAALTGAEATLTSLRQRVRLRWPGACPCAEPRPPPVDQRRPALELALPDAGAWPVEAMAIAPDGAAGLFAEALAVSIDAGGRATRAPPGARFAGPVLAAAAVPGDRFLIASVDRSEASGVRLSLADRSLATVTVRPVGPGGEDLAVRPQELTVAGAGVIAPGETARGEPAVVTCRPGDTATLACARLLPRGLPIPDRRFSRALELPGGLIAAVSEEGSLALIERAAAPSELAEPVIDRSAPGTAAGRVPIAGGGAIRWRLDPIATTSSISGDFETDLLGHLRDRLFLCATASERPHTLVLTTTVSASDLAPGRAPPRWTRALCVNERLQCSGFVRVQGAPDRIRLHTRRGHSIELDASGRAVGQRDGCLAESELAGAPGFEGGDVEATLTSTSWVLVRLESGSVLRRDDRAGASAPVPIHGGSAERSVAYRAIVSRGGGGEMLAFGGAVATSVSREGRVTRSGAIGGLAAGDVITAAAPDTPSGGVLLAGVRGASSTGWIRAAEPDGQGGLRASGAETAIPAAPLDVVEALPGASVILTTGPRFFLRRGAGETLEIPIVWDDPRTSPVEEPPPEEDRACTAALDGELALVRSVASAQGVVYASGCRGVLFRMRVLDVAPRAERVVLPEAIEGVRTEELSTTALSASCADRVTLAAGAAELTAIARWIELALSEERAGPVRGSIGSIGDVPSIDRHAGTVQRILGPPDRPSLLLQHARFGFTFHRIGAPDRARVNAPGLAAAAWDDGSVLIGSSGGRLFIAR